MARANPASELERRQGALGPHHKDEGQVPAAPTRNRRDLVGRRAKEKPDGANPRFVALLARKPARVATIAMANKMARIAWAVMARGDVFRPGHVPVLAA